MEYIKINKNDTFKIVLEKFEKNRKCNLALCLKSTNQVIGIISLGDIRRLLQKKINKDFKVIQFLKKKFIYITENSNKSNYLNDINFQSKKLKILCPENILILDKKKIVKKIIKIEEIYNNWEYKKICVVGLGFIGLPLSSLFASQKLSVIGYDIDRRKIDDLKKNKIPFFEENLLPIYRQAITQGFLKITNNFNFKAQCYIVCVGADLKNKKPNINNLIKIILQITKNLEKDNLICIRGTLSVGDMRDIIKVIKKNTNLVIGKDIYISYCPERIIEGNAINELKTIPQIVSGYSQFCIDKIIKLWSRINTNIIQVASFEAAEIIKLMSNSYRDLSFSFSNEMNRIISKYNMNSYEIIEKANFGYPRNNIAFPSPGVGGSCLVKDPYLFKKNHYGQGYKMADISRKINENAILEFIKKMRKLIKKNFRKKVKILILGLTFKGYPENTDCRCSTSLKIYEYLKKKI